MTIIEERKQCMAEWIFSPELLDLLYSSSTLPERNLNVSELNCDNLNMNSCK